MENEGSVYEVGLRVVLDDPTVEVYQAFYRLDRERFDSLADWLRKNGIKPASPETQTEPGPPEVPEPTETQDQEG